MESNLSNKSKEEIYEVVRKYIFKQSEDFINGVSQELNIPKELVKIEWINNTADIVIHIGDVVCTIDTKVLVEG